MYWSNLPLFVTFLFFSSEMASVVAFQTPSPPALATARIFGQGSLIQRPSSSVPKEQDILEKPDWAGGGLISDMVNILIGIKPIFKILRSGARNVLIQNAEKKGIEWQEESDQLMAKQEELEILLEEVVNKDMEYPDYYLQEFHGYDEGNLNWLAAAECKSATLSMATRVWPTEDMTYDQSQLRLRNSYLDPLEEFIKEVGSSENPKAVVDIGCSVGVSTAALNKRFPSAQVLGLDLSPYFLAVAKLLELETKDSEKASISPISWVHAKAEDTGLADNSIDIVMLTFIVHELPSEATREVLAEVQRILKPGGVVAITDIDPKSPVIQKLPRAISTLMKSTEPWSDQYYILDMEEEMRTAGFVNFKYVVTDPRHSTYYAQKAAKIDNIKKVDWPQQFFSLFSSKQ
mmetsp:Transcript_37427/g.49308  ORF Transcript_37427/g.49308 Transcript_37427/m.49308 type:complete len:404 (-) Transcript_37427:205-1416(-)